jgi:hypothetical protein
MNALAKANAPTLDHFWMPFTPLRGWGAKGKRLRGFAPHGHG